MELYGWNIYREEGLRELKRIKTSKFFAGKDPLIKLIQRYIEIYSGKPVYEKEDISALILFHDELKKAARRRAMKEQEENDIRSLDRLPKSQQGRISEGKATKSYLEKAKKDRGLMAELERAVQDTGSRRIRQFKDHLQAFYDNSEEGNESKYRIDFVVDDRDYRIAIKPWGDKENRQTEDKTGSFGQPLFVIDNWHCGPDLENKDQWLIPDHPFTHEEWQDFVEFGAETIKFSYDPRAWDKFIHLTLRNVGIDISWLEVFLPPDQFHRWKFRAVTHGQSILLKLYFEYVQEITGCDENKSNYECSPVVLLFEYYTSDGSVHMQTYHYRPWDYFRLQS